LWQTFGFPDASAIPAKSADAYVVINHAMREESKFVEIKEPV
jgi:hypothetical protein